MKVKYNLSADIKYDISVEAYLYVLGRINTIPLDGSVVVFNWLTQLVKTGIDMGYNNINNIKVYVKNKEKVKIKMSAVSYSNWDDINI